MFDRDDRAVSEVLGFILIFSLVASTVAIVSVYGFSALEDTRDAEQLNNAERAFDVLADNMADMHTEGAPSRATEISLSRASLEAGPQVSFNLTVVDGGTTESQTFRSSPVIYSGRGDTEIVYSGGAVLRDEREGGVVVREPPMLLSEERVLVPVIQMQHRGDVTSTGGQTVRVRGERRQRQSVVADSQDTYDTFIVNVTSPRAGIWERHFEQQPGMSCDRPREDNVRCTIDDPDSVYVSRTLIYYQFEG